MPSRARRLVAQGSRRVPLDPARRQARFGGETCHPRHHVALLEHVPARRRPPIRLVVSALTAENRRELPRSAEGARPVADAVERRVRLDQLVLGRPRVAGEELGVGDVGTRDAKTDPLAELGEDHRPAARERPRLVESAAHRQDAREQARRLAARHRLVLDRVEHRLVAADHLVDGVGP